MGRNQIVEWVEACCGHIGWSLAFGAVIGNRSYWSVVGVVNVY